MNVAQSKRTYFSKSAHSYVSRPVQRKSLVRTQFRVPRVSTGNTRFPTVNKNFPIGNSKLSTTDLGIKGKADSGCSRHMTGNISYLSDYKPYDRGYVSFGQGGCKITSKGTIKTVTKAFADESELWHRRLGHLNFKTMNKLFRHNLVRGLPSKCFENNHTCVACLKGKQHKASCKTKLVHSVTKPLHTLHMDLFGPTSDETSGILRNLITEIENLKDLKNGVAERRNRTLIEAARTMLADAKFPVTFWAEAVNTACYVQNRVLVNKSQNKNPYKLFNGTTPAIGFLKPFGCHVMILNTLDNLEKFDAKGDEGYFIRYFMSSKAFREAASQDVKKDVSSLRYIALLNWFHEAHLETSTSNAQDACKADAPESSGNSNPTATSTNPSANQMETLTVETLILTIGSPVPTACLDDSLELSSVTRLISKRVTSQDDAPSLDNILTLLNRFEDILGVTANTNDSNAVEADLGNMENNISSSPTPTFRIHKDHPKSPIISPMDTSVQTRTKFKGDGRTEFHSHNPSKDRSSSPKILPILVVNSPSFSGQTVPLFESMLVPMRKCSGTPTEPHHTPSSEVLQSPPTATSSLSLPPTTNETIPTVIPPKPPYSGNTPGELELFSPQLFPLLQMSLHLLLGMTVKRTKMEEVLNHLKRCHNQREEFRDKGGCWCRENGVQVSVPPAAAAATVSVPNVSGMVPTASPIFTTASIVTSYSRHKGKEKMVESNKPKKKKLQEQIDVQVAREIEEQMIAKHLHDYEQVAAELTIGEKIELINELVKYQDHHSKILKYQAQQRKPLSKKQQREFYMSVLRIHAGWKTKHFKDMLKHFDREDLNQLWTLVKETLSIRQATNVKEKELWVELKILYEPNVEDQFDEFPLPEDFPTASEERFPLLRHQVTPKECHLHAVKRIFRYLKGHPKLGLWYPKDSPFDLVAYSDSDYGGATQDGKSTTRGCQCFSRRLISWQCKKQIIIQLLDYGYNFMNTNIYIDNNVSICIVRNPVYHSKTKHIEIRHHFIRDCFEKKLINVDHIHTDENVAGLLTKPFDAGKFQYLVCKLFPLLGKLSTVSVFLGFRLTFAVKNQPRVPRVSTVTEKIPTVDSKFPTAKSTLTADLGNKEKAVKASARWIWRPKQNTSEQGPNCNGVSGNPHNIIDDKGYWDNGFSRHMTGNISYLSEYEPYDGGYVSFVHGYVSFVRIKCNKTEHNTDFYQILDFLKASHIRYALTISPTIYVSHIRQFWSTARIETTDQETKIIATIDDTPRTISESSLRRHLKLNDDEGISSLPDAELFENLSLMGYNILPSQSLQRKHSKLLAKFQAQEVEINRLKERVKILEDKGGVIGDRSRDDAPINGRRIDEEEVATKRVSGDTEEVNWMKGSGSIPTASPSADEVPTSSDVVPTAGPVFATATVIDAQIARELKEQLEREDQRRSEQIARDEEIARIHAEKELQIMIDGLDRSNEIEGGVSKIFKGEAAWLKRKEIRSEKESAKKQKILEEVPEEVKSYVEVPEEKIKVMMQLVPIEEVYVEALQVKHPIIDWDDFNQLWSLVKETLSKRPATSDKEMEHWFEAEWNFLPFLLYDSSWLMKLPGASSTVAIINVGSKSSSMRLDCSFFFDGHLFA
nr:hypothetical protein [Tanacetum cinerariifolium]